MSDFTTKAPEGATFEMVTLKDKKSGTEFSVPLMGWADMQKAYAFYGAEGIEKAVAYAAFHKLGGLARRLVKEGKSHEEIAMAQVTFRFGKRAGRGKDSNRLSRQAKSLIEVQPERAQLLEKLMAKLADPSADMASLQAML